MSELDRIEERFIAGEAHDARRELFELLEDANRAEQLYTTIVTLLPRVRHLEAAATLAMAGGVRGTDSTNRWIETAQRGSAGDPPRGPSDR